MKKFIVACLFGLSVTLSAALCASANSASKKPVVVQVELSNANTLIFEQEITPTSVTTFTSALIGKRMLLEPDQILYIVIASPGGQYQMAKVMRNVIAQMPNVQVICKYCASAAGYVFANSGVKRLAIAKSELMMHEMYLPRLTAAEAVRPGVIENLIQSSDEFNKSMFEKIGISKAEYEQRIRSTEWEVYGSEIVKLHLADQLVEVKCDPIMVKLLPDTCS